MKSSFIFVALTWLAFLPSPASACNGPLVCVIKTYTGNYVTAVGGGGRITDVIHTDAVRARSWERFTLEDSCDGDSVINYGIKTSKGNYLTAVGGGGRITDTIHTDATQVGNWEKFRVICNP